MIKFTQRTTGIYKEFLLFFCITVIFSCSDISKKDTPPFSLNQELDWSYADHIISQIILPEFPDAIFNILNYGAVGDSVTDCTNAINEAIRECSSKKGGTVLIPEGCFLTGAIHLLNNVNLHISEGAVLKFTTGKSKFLPVVHTRFEGMECMNYSPFIYAYKQENIAITGKGILDGQGKAWWSWKGPWDGQVETGWEEGIPNQLKDVAVLLEMVKNEIPFQKRIFGEGSLLRPNFIQPYQCKNVLIEGITLINSPMWIIHPVLSENVTVKNVKIESLGPNNDGCNPESCKNVWIKDCFFNNGDDCIAIKSGRNEDGRRIGIPCENIVIQNCEMKEGHGGIVIGSEMSGDVRNIFAENCKLNSPHLDRALRIKSNSVRGGKVENVFFRNSEVKEVNEAVVKINMFYDWDRAEFIPSVSKIYVNGIKSEKSMYAVWIKAYKDKPVDGLNITDCTFDNVSKGMFIENVENLTIQNVHCYSPDKEL